MKDSSNHKKAEKAKDNLTFKWWFWFLPWKWFGRRDARLLQETSASKKSKDLEPRRLHIASNPWYDKPTSAIRSLIERLSLEEVIPALSKELVEKSCRSIPESRWGDKKDVFAATAKTVMAYSLIEDPIPVNKGVPTIVLFIGPTGVGKSTTVAKLASIASKKDMHNVGLISTDIYRVAATEQLKVFAKLLDLPVAVVRSAEQMKEVLESFSDKDIVFIDTAGQSPGEQQRLDELLDIIREGNPIKRYLVLSATTKQSDLPYIIEQFTPLSYHGFIITKMDESRSHGILLNAPFLSGKPVVYLGTGQAVPQDIEVVSKERIADILLNLQEEISKDVASNP